MALSHLRSLQALELALRTGSMRAAASALWITPAAVGQRIKALEKYLGVDLLVRGRSGLRATPELATAFEHLTAGFRELDTAVALLNLQGIDEIHVAANSDFAELWLKPRIATFKTEHPHVRFCINGDGEAPLRVGPVDCEVSFGPPRNGGGDDLLFRDLVVPIGSPETTRRVARTKKRNLLEGYPLLHLDFYKEDASVPNWTGWLSANRLRRSAPHRGIRFQRIKPAVDAVLANAGFVICGLALVAREIDEGALSLPFPVSTGSWTEHAFRARFRPGTLQRPQMKAFREWLTSQAAGTQSWLKSTSESGPRKRKRRGEAANGSRSASSS